MTDPNPAPPRVLRVITRLNIGGPAIQAISLSERLQAHGFATTLVHGATSAVEGEMTYLLDPAVAVERRFIGALMRPVSPLNDVRAFVQLLGLLRRDRPAIVHTHMAKAGALARAATFVYNHTIGRRTPARVVHTYHGHVLEGYFTPGVSSLFVRLERLFAGLTDVLVAISPTIRDELVGAYGIGRPSQYRVIRLGFDLSPFAAIGPGDGVRARRALDVPPDALVVTTVGRLTAIKQHDLLLEAAPRVLARQPAALFLIAGDGERRSELEAQAHRLGIAHRVRWLGWRRDLPTVYAASDLFVLSSRNEGTPVALIESMASGVPGVSTDVGGVRDVIGGDDVGVRVPDGDAVALAGAVADLLADPARRTAMGRRGRAFVLEQYGIDQLVAEVAHLYRTLLA